MANQLEILRMAPFNRFSWSLAKRSNPLSSILLSLIFSFLEIDPQFQPYFGLGVFFGLPCAALACNVVLISALWGSHQREFATAVKGAILSVIWIIIDCVIVITLLWMISGLGG